MSGFEVLARLELDAMTADIPVVVLTSTRLSRADQLLEALSAAGRQREPAHG